MICAASSSRRISREKEVWQSWPGAFTSAWAGPRRCRRRSAGPVVGNGRRSKFTPEVRLRLGEWIDEQPDLTLHELQSRLRAELGLKASIGWLWDLLREMGLRLKKSHSTPPSRTARRTASGAPYGASK